ELVLRGHRVLVESGRGAGIGLDDATYAAAGATVVSDAETVYGEAELVVKVKEPQPVEIARLRQGQVLFAYLHLAPDLKLTEGLHQSAVTAIAYDTVTAADGSLPLLAPMSEVAGRLAVQAGATCLKRDKGCAGILLGGVPGVDAAHVLIIGGGIVGENAAYIAKGMGAQVTILDTSVPRLRQLDNTFAGRVNCVYSSHAAIEKYAMSADLVIGAVLVTGGAAPKLLTRDIVKQMKAGSVVVDVAIDQGGCFETSRPTTHSDPTYIVDEVVHYCVTNMPAAVARTSTVALNNATMPFVLAPAAKGYRQALADDPHLLNGLNIHQGRVTHAAVARDLGFVHFPAKEALEG